MMNRVLIYFLFILLIACKTDAEGAVENQKNKQDTEMVFDKKQWKIKEGEVYLYRDKMLNDVLYNDTIRSLKKEQLLELLGEPDYFKEGHLYYKITESRLGSWTLKTKTMVVKLADDRHIEWSKVHGQ